MSFADFFYVGGCGSYARGSTCFAAINDCPGTAKYILDSEEVIFDGYTVLRAIIKYRRKGDPIVYTGNCSYSGDVCTAETPFDPLTGNCGTAPPPPQSPKTLGNPSASCESPSPSIGGGN